MTWTRVAAPPPLPPGEVHVWRIDLDAPAPPAPLLEDEARRAAAFRREVDRARFRASRAALRSVLGRYAGVAAERVSFTRACRACGAPDHGKPRLVGSDVAFSLSHSGGLALLAVARGLEVGVDVEAVREDVGVEALASLALSRGERALLAAAPPEARVDLFFRAWTLKEACVKAWGHGLVPPPGSPPLTDLDVLDADGAPRPHVDTPGRPRCFLRPLDAAPGHAAALAVEGVAATVRRLTPASSG